MCTLIRGNVVSEGGLEPPCPIRALAPQASASTYSATRTWVRPVAPDSAETISSSKRLTWRDLHPPWMAPAVPKAGSSRVTR